MAVVRFDNILNQTMAHHIAFVEITEINSGNILQNVFDLDQARYTVRRQVDLRDITRYNSFRIEAQPCQKHLHLLGRGVLRLIQNHE